MFAALLLTLTPPDLSPPPPPPPVAAPAPAPYVPDPSKIWFDRDYGPPIKWQIPHYGGHDLTPDQFFTVINRPDLLGAYNTRAFLKPAMGWGGGVVGMLGLGVLYVWVISQAGCLSPCTTDPTLALVGLALGVGGFGLALSSLMLDSVPTSGYEERGLADEFNNRKVGLEPPPARGLRLTLNW